MNNRFVQPLRTVVQLAFLGITIYIGFEFYRFVMFCKSGGAAPLVTKPNGVEGFIPISGLLGLRDWITSGQLNIIHPAATVILLTVILLCLFLRRSFCSWICPVGTVEEFLWKGGKGLFKRNFVLPKWLDFLFRGIKYVLLAFFLYFVFFAMSSDSVKDFIQSPYNRIADAKMLQFFLTISGIALLVIIIIIIASFFIKNFLCRYICPYGALLGIVATLSPFKVTRAAAKCIKCGECNKNCPSLIKVMDKNRIYSPECVGCLSCISSCKTDNALVMASPVRRFKISGIVFGLLVVLFFTGGIFLGKVTGHWKSSVSPEECGTYLKMNIGHY
ncbi:MAG: 4Fe-4S binding protein [Desulfuromonadales bacterium]|nr:4Fe-4S binding protein [Desulfuromonadales bacterium]